ncbi:hypothetical protein [Tahibacter amnicola]|uniref:HEAT repeat protein n=1 Tax=Tahibacter amnicola TaxID=2976241 RepID=A0ABY6BQA2_9GAMM|nr:hypothetical protein [Tahibacter amnicola]UXI70600.1 hypothetical protein N4264_13440 [Tahibacter amnicola]
MFLPQAEALAGFRWRGRLRAALAVVFRQNHLPDAGQLQRIPQLDAAQLLALADVLRSRQCEQGVRHLQPDESPLPLTRDEQAAICLFLGASHADGRAREVALRLLARSEQRIALFAALIRCDDWVWCVQQQAILMVRNRVPALSGPALFACLGLALALRERARFRADIWPELEAAFREPRHAPERWQVAMNGAPAARRFAAALVMRCDPLRAPQLLATYVSGDDAADARWALCQARDSQDPMLLLQVARRAMYCSDSDVRAEALRVRVDADDADLHDSLRRHAFDPARAVRQVAAYFLKARCGESALALWRRRVDEGRGQRFAAALSALCDNAEKEDLARLLHHRGAATAWARSAVLRALHRISAAQTPACLREALNDPRISVRRQALAIYEAGGYPVTAAEVSAAIAAAPTPEAYVMVLRGCRLLGKWDMLALLLGLFPDADGVQRAAIEQHLGRWVEAACRRFSPLPEEQRRTLLERLARARALGPSRHWHRVADLLS